MALQSSSDCVDPALSSQPSSEALKWDNGAIIIRKLWGNSGCETIMSYLIRLIDISGQDLTKTEVKALGSDRNYLKRGLEKRISDIQ